MNSIGCAFVGSSWVDFCSTVTSGLVVSKTTVLSVDVETVLPFPASSSAPFAGTSAVTVPSAVIPETATSYVSPDPVTTTVAEPVPAVPLSVTSSSSNPSTGSVKTAVK